MADADPRFAFISQGKLFVRDGASARQIECEFGVQAAQRAQEVQERRGWQGGDRQAGMVPAAMLWGARQTGPTQVRMEIPSVAPGQGGSDLMFILDSDSFGGLFVHELATSKERRVMHRSPFRARDLAIHPSNPEAVYSLREEDGSAHIVHTDLEHTRAQPVTAGDSVDEAPTWSPGVKRRIVYQSAGLARNVHGFPVALGPASVCRLDLDSGAHEALVESPQHDYLSPRLDAAGDLWFIRRPYRGVGRYSPVTALKDIVLFPFRLGRTIFHYLNFMSLIYSQKPLSGANSMPLLNGPDPSAVMLRGRAVAARHALRDSGRRDGPRALVPKSWELAVRRAGAQADEVVARGVVAFDLDGHGGVLYSNGAAIYLREPSGEQRLLERGRVIENVVALRPAA
jgi:hypothetical protein